MGFSSALHGFTSGISNSVHHIKQGVENEVHNVEHTLHSAEQSAVHGVESIASSAKQELSNLPQQVSNAVDFVADKGSQLESALLPSSKTFLEETGLVIAGIIAVAVVVIKVL